jgi:hypothetical protein
MRGRRSRRAESSAFTSRPGAGSIQAWWWSWSTRRRPHRRHGPRNALVLRLPLGALIALVSAALVPGYAAPPAWGTAAAAMPPLVALDDDKEEKEKEKEEKEKEEKEKEEQPKDDSNPPGGQGPPASPPGQSSPPPVATPAAPPAPPKASPSPAPPPASKAKAEPKASKPSAKASTKAEPKKPKAAAAKITATPTQVATPSVGAPSQPAPTSTRVSGATGGSSVGAGSGGGAQTAQTPAVSSGGAQTAQTPAVSSGGARSVQTPDVSSGGASPEGRSSGAGSAGTAQPPVTAPGRPVPRGFRATPARFLASSRRRARGTTLTFVLRKAGRVRFIVLGRAPDCRPLGRFSRAARRGPNRIRFLGRLRGKPLPAGRYTIVAEVMRARRWKPLARVTVVVLAPNRELSRARANAPARAECRRAPVTALSVGHSRAATLPPSSLAAATVRSSAAAAAQPQPGSGGVAGASAAERSASAEADSDPISDLPVLSAIIPENSVVPPMVLGLVALVAVAIGGVFLMALVLKFVRHTWEP